MSGFVNTVDSIGDEALTNSIIDRSIVEFSDNYVTSVGANAFLGSPNLNKVDMPSVTSIGESAFKECASLMTAKFSAATSVGNYAFQYCSSLETVDMPVAQSVGTYTFYKCTNLTKANFPAAQNVGSQMFYGCTKLKTADFSVATRVNAKAFEGCSALTELILRSETVATLGATTAFTNTPIASGTGYIYVPAALVDSYKAAANWSTYANQFRAIEDYPDICGT